MRLVPLLVVAMVLNSFAANSAPQVYETREYSNVSRDFVTWVERKGDAPRGEAVPENQTKGKLGADQPWPEGASSIYVPGDGKLIVKHTAAFLDSLEQLLAQWRQSGDKFPPDAKLIEVIRSQCPPRAKKGEQVK